MKENRNSIRQAPGQNTISIMTVIVARKVDFFNLIKESNAYLEERDYSELFFDQLNQIIARMNPGFFMTKEEIDSRILRSETRLEDLDRAAIFREIKREMKSR